MRDLLNTVWSSGEIPCRRSLWTSHRASVVRPGRNPDRRVRSAPHAKSAARFFLRDRRIDAYAPICSDGWGQVSGSSITGWRMPAEWSRTKPPGWPGLMRNPTGPKSAPIPWLYGETAPSPRRVERVRILVQDRDAEEGVRKILKKCHAELAAVEFFHHPTNRSWTRDYCPSS